MTLALWMSFAGGAVIGLAAALFAALNGRIAGISGVVGGLLRPRRGDVGWRVAFVAGLVAAPLVFGLFAAWPSVQVDAGAAELVAAGLLVGLGTRYGAGCTSGHGVCGVARWSVRSLVATAAFMASGFATVFVLRHVLGHGHGYGHAFGNIFGQLFGCAFGNTLGNTFGHALGNTSGNTFGHASGDSLEQALAQAFAQALGTTA